MRNPAAWRYWGGVVAAIAAAAAAGLAGVVAAGVGFVLAWRSAGG